MNSLPELIAPLTERSDAEPWVRFCAQCIEHARPCVLVSVLEAPPGAPCRSGEHFAYDADGHGLLPRDLPFSIALHRLTQQALKDRSPGHATLPTASGGVRVSLIPFTP